MAAEVIINKVAQSGLMSIDLEEWYGSEERVVYDLKQNLFMELILKEKDFREFLKNHDWSFYKNKHVAIICSSDAIIPTWAYMLLIGYLSEHALTVIVGNLEILETQIYFSIFDKHDFEQYKGQRLVVKGCSQKPIPHAVYAEFTRRVKPLVRSVMFGEPCSTVPLFKNKLNE
jgi:hypothetical protein